MKQRSLFGGDDGDESKSRRDDALEHVSRPAFQVLALAVISELPMSWKGTGETLRHAIEARGIVPHHHNAWGALVMSAIKQGYLYPSGRGHMLDPQSHHRSTNVYSRSER